MSGLAPTFPCLKMGSNTNCRALPGTAAGWRILIFIRCAELRCTADALWHLHWNVTASTRLHNCHAPNHLCSNEAEASARQKIASEMANTS